MEMVFCGGEDVKPDVVCERRDRPHFLDQLLIAVVVPRDRSEPFAIFKRPGNRGQNEKHKFHCGCTLIRTSSEGK